MSTKSVDQSSQNETAFEFMETGIKGLDKLFSPDCRQGNGIVFPKETGFFGMITGAAGTGKSVLTLELCCAFVREKNERRSILVTQECKSTIESKIVHNFRYLDKKLIAESESELFGNDSKARNLEGEEIAESESESLSNDDKPRMAIVNMPLDSAAQKETLNYLLTYLAGQVEPNKRTNWLICIDNVETINPEVIKNLLDTKQGDYYKALREFCGEKRLNTWWVFEEGMAESGSVHSTASIATTPQAYAADVVIRLSARENTAWNFRDRDLEIVKLKYQSFRRGRHAIAINNYVEPNDSKKGLPNNAHVSNLSRKRKVGLDIWPSIATQLSEARSINNENSAAIQYHLGIDKIDKAIDRQRADRSKNSESVGAGLASGSVTVLVSDLDSLASGIASYFALNGKESSNDSPTGKDAVIISTVADKDKYRELIRQYKSLEGSANEVRIEYLPPIFLNENKLLKVIADSIGDAKRVVIDNIYALESRFHLIRNIRAFLASLFGLLRSKNVATFIVDIVEVGEGKNPLGESFAAGLADNVFLLRHVEFQSQVRKVFHVLRLETQSEPPQFWELNQNDDIEADDRLDFYKGVLTGRPEPLEINLSLFADAENSPMDFFLKAQSDVMLQTIGPKVRINVCYPSGYAALQHSLATGAVRPSVDCHVISVDEIWLKKLLEDDLLEKFSRKSLYDNNSEEWNYRQYVTNADDLAVHLLRNREGKKSTESHRDDEMVVVPDRGNIGVLAFNPNVLSYRSQTNTESHAPNLVQNMKVLLDWAKRFDSSEEAENRESLKDIDWRSKDNRLKWPDLVDLQSEYVKFVGNLKIPDTNTKLSEIMPPSASNAWEDWEQSPMEEEADVRRFKPGRDLWARNFRIGNQKEVVLKGEFAELIPTWGVFTFAMNQRESFVSFLLELFLSVTKKEEYPADKDGIIDWALPDTDPDSSLEKTEKKPKCKCTAWGRALELFLQLLSPWDILRVSHGWYRSTNDERPCLFSRQWFSNWGVLGIREPGLNVMELPKGLCGTPTPVSGTWYLGILKNSSATQAGVKLIKHLTSSSRDLYKANRGIGLPVRAPYYGAVPKKENDKITKWTLTPSKPLNVRPNLPYRQELINILNSQIENSDDENKQNLCSNRLLQSRCPYYRTLIKDYHDVSSLLMGVIAEAAKVAVSPKFEKWLWNRDTDSLGPLREEIEKLVQQAKADYEIIISNTASWKKFQGH